MRFIAPFIFAAAVVSAAPTVKFSEFKPATNNAATCDACKTLSANADATAVNNCLKLVPATCTYTAKATITGAADVCPSAWGVKLDSVINGLTTAEVTGMTGNLDLTVVGSDATAIKGGCTLDAMVSNTEQCVENVTTPTGGISASLTDGKGSLPLTNVKEKYISMKATTASGATGACGVRLNTATFNGASATVSLKGLKADTPAPPATTTPPPAGANGVSPVIGGSLLLGLLGALHMI